LYELAAGKVVAVAGSVLSTRTFANTVEFAVFERCR
jgi:hypothetical protein